ncbi:MAG: hypothetical protein AMJ42_05915 [Deltaproteobacteria bacterium DG_8]|nr:MAG: hypothetical protein AMJ42_05915 [Deltaproteobacteria bacterium DG_8]
MIDRHCKQIKRYLQFQIQLEKQRTKLWNTFILRQGSCQVKTPASIEEVYQSGKGKQKQIYFTLLIVKF